MCDDTHVRYKFARPFRVRNKGLYAWIWYSLIRRRIKRRIIDSD